MLNTTVEYSKIAQYYTKMVQIVEKQCPHTKGANDAPPLKVQTEFCPGDFVKKICSERGVFY